MLKYLNEFIQKRFNWICETFTNDTSKMLIVTGTLGWVLSSVAQIAGIYSNDEISDEKKSFLIPQEFMDGGINALSFIGITTIAKRWIEKMASTGKIAPQSVRTFLNQNPELKAKVGKFDFNLGNVIPQNIKAYKSYTSHKNFITTMGTLGASVLSCNIVTPLIRNAMASRVQKNYIDMKKNPSLYNKYHTSQNGNMRI